MGINDATQVEELLNVNSSTCGLDTYLKVIWVVFTKFLVESI